ncbi:urea carboxylase [Vibrio breoganii]|uniref:Urea carboxylase n=1 Tax=Vibrio breoganii TaxID=553239 RepID=A0AAN0XX81_9VIBR|nr:urea amidolyase associated protein UAAP1 [Vibrio breoganii]ANO34244.1 urea carboxylase [Vibrio breoganii]PMG80523.1 urea carboxylase [Vibrio breoganii]PMI17702.1 urea carboxylase [Vibrio breoganii]PMK42859.1 urea carboxylase [Vibrio breoganii]PML05118.1 urea carboxylase [Vibrio breoganii]
MQINKQALFTDVLPGAAHWSMKVPKGHVLRFKDLEGGANLSLLMYNPDNLLERYNAPDTLKGQHTFKLTKGNCLYSDMGRVFASIVRDDTAWIDSVAGVTNKEKVTAKWGARDYQSDRNQWKQNGYDSLLVEVAKYGLGKRDLAANLNLFSKVFTKDSGDLCYQEEHSKAGDIIELRFEMDTLVVMTTCPHPMNPATSYPFKPVELSLLEAEPLSQEDTCLNSRPENERGFENNRRYLVQHGSYTV